MLKIYRFLAQTLAVTLLIFVWDLPSQAADAGGGYFARVQVFDVESGDGVFDSGVVRADDLERRTKHLAQGGEGLTFELRVWNGEGQLVVNRAAGLKVLGALIQAISFDTIPPGTKFGSPTITLDGDVDATGSVAVDGDLLATTLKDGFGLPFFDACTSGNAVRVLNADGSVVCEPAGGVEADNLGDHTATQNLQMAGHWISRDGDSEGLQISSTGAVGVGVAAPVEPLEVAGNVRLAAGSRIYFGSGTDTRMSESSGNVTIYAHLDGNSDIEFSAEDNVEIEADNDVYILPDDDVFIEPNDDVIIDPHGGVGFGNVSNPDRLITVEQGTTKDPIADEWETYSSVRWKTDIHQIESPLELLDQLQGVRYLSKLTGESEIGLIAEDVGRVIPEIVSWEEDGVWAEGVSYARLVALLVESGKEQSRRIDQLRDEIEALRSELASTP